MKALKAVAVWCLGLAALVVISLPDVAQGQVAKSPSEIPTELRAGAQLMRSALQSLDNAERAHALAFQAYVQLRAAQGEDAQRQWSYEASPTQSTPWRFRR